MSLNGAIATDLTLNWIETLDNGFEHATGEWTIERPWADEPVELYQNSAGSYRLVMETDLATAVYFVMRQEAGEYP